jgi:hypothetical protein
MEQEMKRITKASIQRAMWNAGRPSTTGDFASIFFAARKAGLNYGQAQSLACIAYDAAHGFLENMVHASTSLRRATLERKATEHPRSVWAYLRATLGTAFPYVTDADIHKAQNSDYQGWLAWANSKDEKQQEVA